MPRDALNGLLGTHRWTIASVAGALCYLLIYLLGGVPGLPSPLLQPRVANGDVLPLLRQHTEETRHLKELMAEFVRVERVACRGAWRGNGDMQKVCGPVDDAAQ